MELNFKQWLSEWEGNSFATPPEMTNGPAYAERGIRSKNMGPGRKNPDPRDGQKMPKPEGERLRKKWGFERGDFLLAINKMKKKMEKQ
jgi:hypothetical protein